MAIPFPKSVDIFNYLYNVESPIYTQKSIYPLHRYTSEVSRYETDLSLSQIEIDFLQRIAQERCSAYSIFAELRNLETALKDNTKKKVRILPRTDLKRTGKSMAYKNVHRRIHKLLEFRLIKEIKLKGSLNVHKAKVYEITSKGIFFLIYFKLFLIRIDDLIQYHGDVILETILFPYFEDNTLKRSTTHFMSILSLYLGNCCDITLREAKRIQEEPNIVEKQRIANSLMDELRGAAKSMAVRLLNGRDSTAGRSKMQEQESTFSYPREDKKFEKLTIELKQDVDQWFARDIPKS